jgi:hypothetical protein
MATSERSGAPDHVPPCRLQAPAHNVAHDMIRPTDLLITLHHRRLRQLHKHARRPSFMFCWHRWPHVRCMHRDVEPDDSLPAQASRKRSTSYRLRRIYSQPILCTIWFHLFTALISPTLATVPPFLHLHLKPIQCEGRASEIRWYWSKHRPS